MAEMSVKNPTQETIFNYLEEAKNIAVVGLSNKPERKLHGCTGIARQWI